MSRLGGLLPLAIGLGLVALAGLAAGRVSEGPHGRLAASAAGVMLAAAVAAGLAESLLARLGGEALVLAYWVGVGLRGTLGLGGALIASQTRVPPDDRAAFWLWVLAAYLTALTIETVRLVREADRAAGHDLA